MRETGGLEIASAITLVLQANQPTKCASHPKGKERLREQARNKYRNLSEEGKNKKREYGKNRCHNISEEKKQRLKEYQKIKYREAKMSRYNNE